MAITAAFVNDASSEPGRPGPGANVQHDRYGAIIRGDRTASRLALVFTGDEFGESAAPILDALRARKITASFFVTGNLLRDAKLRPHVERMVAAGHYVGPHSDRHLLYCDWDARDKSLVSRAEFDADLKQNLADLRMLGAPPAGVPAYFIAPYEWYNREQVEWARALDVELVNFTPGTGSNRDYAREGDRAFVPAQTIYDDILAYEQANPDGLNGFLLLLHLGSGRQDPFHPHLGQLCDQLAAWGYRFVRIDELCTTTAPSVARDERYPAAWFAPAPTAGAPAWEILPQAAGAGEVILSKRNELGILSNFAPTPFTFRGKRYASLEGFWQAMKFPEGPDDPRAHADGVKWRYTRDEVEQLAGFDAKNAGGQGSGAMQRLGIDWVSFEGRRFLYRPATPGEHYELIVAAMRAKLEQNPEVRRVLLATGDLALRPDHRQEPKAPAAWRYYEIWMQLREELQAAKSPAAQPAP